MLNYFSIVWFSFFLFVACGNQEKGEAISQGHMPTPLRSQVVVASPTVEVMQESLTMNAVTTYTHRENIRATTTGYVQQTKVELGLRIKDGQQVFILKTREAEALGEELLKDPKINISGIIPVIAKNSGIITQVFFQDGDYVAEGDILAELTKPSSLAVKLFVPYEYSSEVKLLKHVSVRLPDGEKLTGTIKQLLPSEDIISQTTPYLVTLAPFRFLPENLNVTVTVPTLLSPKALVIERQSLQSNEEQTEFWIMKLISDSVAIRIPVEIGIQDDNLIELKNTSLTVSDRIVLQGAYGLPDTAMIVLAQTL